jgi:hypothetical protein
MSCGEGEIEIAKIADYTRSPAILWNIEALMGYQRDERHPVRAAHLIARTRGICAYCGRVINR